MNRTTRMVLAVLLAVCLWPADSRADRCNVTATAVAFGGYDPLDPTPTTATGSISVTCATSTQNSLPIMVLLSAGSAGSFTPRQMTSAGPARLAYNIYTTPAHTVIWGDGTGGTSVVSGLATRGGPFTASMFALAPALQNLPVGSYGDTLTVTVLW